MIETEREEAKRLYGLITNNCLSDEQIQDRVQIIRRLESITGHDFKSTADFIQKMDDYLLSDETAGQKLLAIRKDKGWSLARMGAFLGVSRQLCHQMEAGTKPLNNQAHTLILSTKA